jgi:hypothetical protein
MAQLKLPFQPRDIARGAAARASGSLGPYRWFRECMPTPGGPLLIDEGGGVLRPTCESCLAIDVRNLHREGLLRPGRAFSWSLRAGDEPLGSGARYRSPKTYPYSS